MRCINCDRRCDLFLDWFGLAFCPECWETTEDKRRVAFALGQVFIAPRTHRICRECGHDLDESGFPDCEAYQSDGCL
jgi:hypothetical protein